MPADGRARNAVIGASADHGGSAPAQRVVDDIAARLIGGGWIWATQSSDGSAEHALLRVTDANVLIEVEPGGGAYSVTTRAGEVVGALEVFDSLAP